MYHKNDILTDLLNVWGNIDSHADANAVSLRVHVQLITDATSAVGSSSSPWGVEHLPIHVTFSGSIREPREIKHIHIFQS